MRQEHRPRGNPLRALLLLAIAGCISAAIFALVPLLLRQTAHHSDWIRESYALLIPVQPEPPPPPEPRRRERPEPPPEPPEPPEPELEPEPLEPPDVPEPEVRPPDLPPPEMALPTLEQPSPALTPMELPAPATPRLETQPLDMLRLSELPIQSSPLNLRVHVAAAKAPVPRALPGPVAPRPAPATKTRYSVGEIDEQPVGIATIKPVYPFHARRRGTEGYVTVQFLVDRAGEVQELSIVEAKPSGVFERSVRKTVPRWRFRPGKKDGRAVETWVRMTIRFELGNDA